MLKSVLSEGSCQLMKRSEKRCTREPARRESRRAQFLSVAHFAARLSCACRWMPATWLRRNLLHLRNHLADFGQSSYTGISTYNQAGGSVIRTERMLRAWVLPAVVVRSARRVQRATRIEHASSDDRMQTSDFPNRSIAFDPQKYRLFSALEQHG